MANVLGYELISVGQTAIGPTASIVQGGVACAIFHVDPESHVGVRWRPLSDDPDIAAHAHVYIGRTVGSSCKIEGCGATRSVEFQKR